MKNWLIVLVSLFSFSAMAQDIAIIAGVRSDNADAETTSVSINGVSSVQVGATAKFELSGPWQARTGFIYLTRAYELTSGSAKTDYKFSYVEVPFGVLYKFSDYGGAFIGPAMNLNLSKDCGSGTCTGVNSPLFLQFGASLKFAPQMGFEFYYETGMSKIADGVKSPRGVVANFMVTFD